MATLSYQRVTVIDGKIQIDTNRKDFLIRKISPTNLTEAQFNELNNAMSFDSGWTHEDLQTFDSKLKSGSKISHPALPANGTILHILISVF